jgi:hypothetical protein
MRATVEHPINSLDQAAMPVQAPRDASPVERADAALANVGAGAAQVVRHPIKTAETALASITPQPLIDASVRKFNQENPGARIHQHQPITWQSVIREGLSSQAT